jgi:Uma2 family endonuclease
MNELFTMPQKRVATQAAEGLPRWRWTVAEIERAAAADVFGENDRFELLGGEIVPMSPEGPRHLELRAEIALRMSQLAASWPSLMVVAEPQFNLSSDTFMKPDVLVHPRRVKTYHLRPADALLLIEIADTSLAYDLKTKMPRYADHGVPEYWVVHAATLMTTVHREPAGSSYRLINEISAKEMLVPSLVPQLAISLATLGLD